MIDKVKFYEEDRIRKVEEIILKVGMLPEHLTRYLMNFQVGGVSASDR